MPCLLTLITAAALTSFSLGNGHDVAPSTIRIVTLGDSITKGVRSGVLPSETFSAYLEAELRTTFPQIQVLNRGIGGESTDQALRRLQSDVIDLHPDFVLIMYGTNDSYIDRGRSTPRLTAHQYAQNLREIVSRLRSAGIRPLLMTPPRWAPDTQDGAGKNPNLSLEPFIQQCREVACELAVPLIDHYTAWSDLESAGTPIRRITTDGYHPNPEGHATMSQTILPTLMLQIESAFAPSVEHPSSICECVRRARCRERCGARRRR